MNTSAGVRAAIPKSVEIAVWKSHLNGKNARSTVNLLPRASHADEVASGRLFLLVEFVPSIWKAKDTRGTDSAPTKTPMQRQEQVLVFDSARAPNSFCVFHLPSDSDPR